VARTDLRGEKCREARTYPTSDVVPFVGLYTVFCCTVRWIERYSFGISAYLVEEAVVVRGKITGGIACGVIAGLSGLVSALVVVAELGGLNNPEDNLFCAALGFIPASLIGAFVGMLAWSTGSKRQHVVGLLIATVLGLVTGALSLLGLVFYIVSNMGD